MSIKKQFRLLTDFFEQNRFQYALAGAFALHGYGYTRATRDLDFVTGLEQQKEITDFLESLGYDTIGLSEGFSQHLHPLEAARIDIIYVDESTGRRLFSMAARIRIFDDLTLPIIAPLHLIAMKLFAIRNDPTRKLKDLADIRELLERTDVDRDLVRQYFVQNKLERYLHEVMEILEDD